MYLGKHLKLSLLFQVSETHIPSLPGIKMSHITIFKVVSWPNIDSRTLALRLLFSQCEYEDKH